MVRLRTAWRVSIAEDLGAENRERPALEALQLIEHVLIMAPSENLHRMRALGSRSLGDDKRLLESSAVRASHINTYLTTSASQGFRLSAGEQWHMRRNLAVIADQLGDDLGVADPQRLSTVLQTLKGLIQYVDDYPQANIGFTVRIGVLDGPTVCGLFNRTISTAAARQASAAGFIGYRLLPDYRFPSASLRPSTDCRRGLSIRHSHLPTAVLVASLKTLERHLLRHGNVRSGEAFRKLIPQICGILMTVGHREVGPDICQ